MAVTLLFTGYYRHPKLVVAGEAAEILWCRGLDYVNEHGTDGFIPTAMPPMLTPTKTTPRVKALVGAGLWLAVDGGWQYHDFHEWNRTAEQLEARQVAISKKRSLAGKKGANSRWNGRLAPVATESKKASG